MTQILDELNGKWDTLSDAQQKALSNAIAGKTQSNVEECVLIQKYIM